jgi:hypothetical protein
MTELQSTLEHQQVANGEDVAHLIKDARDKLELEHHYAAEGARIHSSDMASK